jgi:hypothetical protein
MLQLHNELEAECLKCDPHNAGYMEALRSRFVGKEGKPSFDLVFPKTLQDQKRVEAMPTYVRTALAFLMLPRLDDDDILFWDITALVLLSTHTGESRCCVCVCVCMCCVCVCAV